MPFAALPSSPGFMQPTAPDWGRFASQANEMILKGGEQRAQANKDLISQMDKNAEQISKIMQYNSPEAKAERRMKMIQTAYLEKVYNDATLHPEKYQMTAHGPILKDPLAVLQRQVTYNNAITSGETMKENLKSKRDADAARTANDMAIARAAADKAKLAGGSGTPDTSGTADASAQATLEPDPSQPNSPAAPANTSPLPVPAVAPDTGAWHQSQDAQGASYWYTDEGQYSDTPP